LGLRLHLLLHFAFSVLRCRSIRMGKIATSKIKRGSLIQYALDGITRESFDVIKMELANVLKHRAGVYALYQNNKLVRVGLGTNIYWRLKGHAKSKNLVPRRF